MGLTSGDSFSEFLSRNDVERIEPVYFNEQLTVDVAPFTVLPNDFEDIITGGRNTALDLIRAPLAWTITRGEGQILGWTDAKIYEHEDLVGKVIFELDVPPYSGQGDLQFTHGATTSGMAAANTINNIGISSVAPEAMIASSPKFGINYIDSLITNVPEIRVINASWGGCLTNPNSIQAEKYQDFLDRGYLIVAAGGNLPCAEGQLFYPSSYESTLGVTTVGHRIAPTYDHGITLPEATGFRSWKDVYLFRTDVSNTAGHNLRADHDVTAPGQLLTALLMDVTTQPFGSTYILRSATSPATPFVTGVAALVFAANPNLTAQEVKDIIKNTADDIYHIPYNEDFVGLLGTGRVNAYRAVLTAKCMDDPNYLGNLDLMVRNSMVDYGVEPDINTGNVMWHTSEIWVRPNAGESYIDVHENPEYDPVIPNYVNVRVTNRSCVTSTGDEELTLYWAKANTALNWPDHWDGSLTMGDITNTSSTTPVGDIVGTLNIPPLEPGQEAILEFEWMVPNPEDYLLINPNPWHFCLLARIESPNEPMTFPEDTFITDNVRNNNNIAWKNTTVVDIIPNTPTIGGLVAVSNPFTSSKTYTLELFPEANEIGKVLYEEAEIGIEMDEVLYQAWSRGNKQKSNLKATSNEKKFVVFDSLARFENIQFDPNEYGTAYVTFNFLSKELTGKRNYTYHLAQIDESNSKTIGGETFEIRKKPRPGFTANAGDDEEIDKSESVTLQAADINEDAIYNWYDVDGNLIYTGTSITVSPQFTQQYKLEVISNLDGLKDYDELQVIVNPYKIQSLIPNPVTSTVTVNYIADEAASAYLMVVHQNTGNTNNYIIDTEENSHAIDLSGFASGLYSIILVCDGEIQGSKNLVKQ